MLATSSTTSTVTCHNGPICGTCGARYIGSHACSPADLERRVAELLALIAAMRSVATPAIQVPTDRTASCPCRPENGGSGVCGCVLGGWQVTC